MSQPALIALGIAVLGTFSYHLAQRAIPADANPALVLALAYLGGAAICVALLATVFPPRDGLRLPPAGPTLALAVAVVLIEVGFLLMYRNGWSVATGGLVVNVISTLALTGVALALLGERLTLPQLGGALLCLVGLALISYRG